MSRAMDCSRTAARTHLSAADDTMRARLGGAYEETIVAMRSFADGLDPGPIIAANRLARKKTRFRRRTAVAIGAAIVGLAVLLVLLELRLI